MTTRVFSSAGTACITPSRISFLFPFQKANSERWTLLRVSLRPMPSLAVTQRMEDMSPGLRRFSAGSRVGFSNTSSLALECLHMGWSLRGK